MTDRTTKRKKKDERLTTKGPAEPPTKLHKKVAHWLRKNVPTKKTKFLHAHIVEYFTASKAVDALLHDSPWAMEKVSDIDKAEITFGTREQCISFMEELLAHKMFHRARKIPVPEKSSKKGSKKDERTDEDESAVPGTPKDGDKDGKKKKRKIRLDMHLDQVFLDGTDAYVWLYDPIAWYYWAGGTAIVLGTIAVCMFPLWPPMMRTGVHYLSVAAAGFLLGIMGIAIFKYLLFSLLFALSGGHLKFWLFPNLTEDVGFFESFLPLYDYTYTGKTLLGRRKKAKDSDDEEEDDEEEEEEEENEENEEKANNADHSESDESTSKKSSTGKDFEMVDKNDDTEVDTN